MTASCPRCRASGFIVVVELAEDDEGICENCGTHWRRGARNEMIALP